jgi:alpha-L-arabinofuranosidase
MTDQGRSFPGLVRRSTRFFRSARRVAGLGTVTAAVVAVAGLPAVPSSAQSPTVAPADPAPIRITVSDQRYMTADGKAAGVVPAAVVGANQRWPDDGKGVWDTEDDRPADDIVKLSRETGLHMLRYPGGTVANMFDFSRAIGPQDQRQCQTSGGFANGRFAPTDSRFGPDENEKLAEAIGGETMVMVPAINQSAADAANYVEYMNYRADGAATNPNGGVDWAELRARNGHRQPYGIHYWEFGNEPFLDGQHYWWSVDRPTRLQQFIEGGWQRQTAQDAVYQDNDGLFLGCDLANRREGSGEPNQAYRVRFPPIALPGDEQGSSGVGDGPITEPVLRVGGTVWQRVDSLAGQGPDAQVYAIDPVDGIVRFGDGTNGVVPPAGASLSIEYTSGVHEGFLGFREAMKEVDPSIEVCSGWGEPEFVEAMGSRPYDCLGPHSHSRSFIAPDGTPPPYGTLQVAAADRNADLRELRDRMAHHFPDVEDRPDLLVTEYGFVTFRDFYEARLAHVLHSAALVAGQLENDVRASVTSNTSELPMADGSPHPQNLFGSPGDFLMTGRAHMLRLFSAMVGDRVVTSTVTGNPTLAAPTGTYDALRVVSSCTGDMTRTIVINRDPEDAIPADVSVPSRRLAQQVTVSTLNGDTVDSFNAPDHPNDITVRTTHESLDQGVLPHEFEPHSVTLLQFTGPGPCGS